MKKSLHAFAFSAVSITVTTSTAILAQDVQMPHTFEAGTPALASEVNANFDVLTDAINATQAAIGSLTGGQVHQIGVLEILHQDYGVPIPVVGLEWATAWIPPEGGGFGTPHFGPLVVLKAVDNYSPSLFRDQISQQTFLDITVEVTSPDGKVSSYFVRNPRISRFETVTTSGGITLDRVAFSGYDLVQLSVNDPATNTDTVICWDVSSHTVC